MENKVVYWLLSYLPRPVVVMMVGVAVILWALLRTVGIIWGAIMTVVVVMRMVGIYFLDPPIINHPLSLAWGYISLGAIVLSLLAGIYVVFDDEVPKRKSKK